MSYILNIMGRKKTIIMPTVRKQLEELGENIRLARLRRSISVELVAERAGISRATVWAIENGSPSVAIGSYAAVLFALGLSSDLSQVASDDEVGRKLQDLAIIPKKRAPKKAQPQHADLEDLS